MQLPYYTSGFWSNEGFQIANSNELYSPPLTKKIATERNKHQAKENRKGWFSARYKMTAISVNLTSQRNGSQGW